MTALDPPVVGFEWLDFADGTPVLDFKRYNWRWECILGARRLDRRFIERQIPVDTLSSVLTRACTNFHGEACEWMTRAGLLGAKLVQENNVWLGSPSLVVRVDGNRHLVDALQGLTAATLGNGRLLLEQIDDGDHATVELRDDTLLLARWKNGRWVIDLLA